jgi:hypothetical protein
MACGTQRLMNKQSSGNRVAEALLKRVESIKLPGYYAIVGKFPTWIESAWILTPGLNGKQGGR